MNCSSGCLAISPSDSVHAEEREMASPKCVLNLMAVLSSAMQNHLHIIAENALHFLLFGGAIFLIDVSLLLQLLL